MSRTIFCSFQLRGSVVVSSQRWKSSFDVALQNVPETQLSKLNNGFTVASEDSGLPTCTVSSVMAEFFLVLYMSSYF